MDNAIYWIGLGALLFLIEVLSGSGFLLFFGISAFAVAVLPWMFSDISLSVQLIIFSVLAVLDALFWKRILKNRRAQHSDKPFLNKKTEQFIGQTFVLQSPITRGTGSIKIGDSIWQVKCNEDLPVTEIVTVVGTEGAVLKVRHTKKA